MYILYINKHIYIYVCVCVCMCVILKTSNVPLNFFWYFFTAKSSNLNTS